MHAGLGKAQRTLIETQLQSDSTPCTEEEGLTQILDLDVVFVDQSYLQLLWLVLPFERHLYHHLVFVSPYLSPTTSYTLTPCHLMSQHVTAQHSLSPIVKQQQATPSPHVTSCHNMSPHSTPCHPLSNNNKLHPHPMSPHVTTCHRTALLVTHCQTTTSYTLTPCHLMSQHVTAQHSLSPIVKQQ